MLRPLHERYEGLKILKLSLIFYSRHTLVQRSHINRAKSIYMLPAPFDSAQGTAEAVAPLSGVEGGGAFKYFWND